MRQLPRAEQGVKPYQAPNARPRAIFLQMAVKYTGYQAEAECENFPPVEVCHIWLKGQVWASSRPFTPKEKNPAV
jgi:hypothetical protein